MIRQMVEKGNPQKMCFFITDNQFSAPPDISKHFTAYIALEMTLKTAQTFLERKDIFTDSNFEVYTSIRTLIIRKGLKEEKREHFRKFLTMLLEMGHPIHFRRDFPDVLGIELATKGDKEAPKIYWGLQEYIIENTRVQGLTFNQLDHLARLYFGVIIATLLANFVHYLILRPSMKVSFSILYVSNHAIRRQRFSRRLLVKQRIQGNETA